MQFEPFRSAFDEALRESNLRLMGVGGEETLGLRSLDRTYEVHVEPAGGQGAEPFWVSASVSFRWDSLSTARTRTREEDTLTVLYGPDSIPRRKTAKPYHRIDVTLNASLMDGTELPLPSNRAWASWAKETMGRLEGIEPVTPDATVREDAKRNLMNLEWARDPEAELRIGPGGELRLRAVRIKGFQLMETPRALDVDIKPDEGPHGDLQQMFHRVRASLVAWGQTLDHLKKIVLPSDPDRLH